METIAVIPLQNSRFIPVLSENAFLRYISFAALYVAQGIPEGLTFFAIPAWMAMNGKTPAEIGSFAALVILPWSCKIIVAPLMDRFTFLAMGRRRPWVIFGQLGLIVSFISMAFMQDPLNHMDTLMIAGFCVSFFGAFQDVAVDGMAIDIIPINQQARANGIMWGSKTVGISVSMAIGSWLINAYGFFYAVTALSSIIVLIMLIPVCIIERPGEKLLPWTKGMASASAKKLQLESWRSIFKSLASVFFLRSSIIMAAGIFIVAFAFNLMNALLPVFTVQKLGWTDVSFSQVTATANLTAGLLGMIAGGALVDYFGKKRMINIYLVLLIILTTIFSFQNIYWSNQSFVIGFITSYYLLYTFITIAIFSICMQLCWKRVSITQFTCYMTIYNIGYAFGARSLGPFKHLFEWEHLILVITILAAVMLVLLRFIYLDNHTKRVTHLETKYIIG